MSKLTPRPFCTTCGKLAGTEGNSDEIWTITKDGNWICNDCYLKTLPVVKAEINCKYLDCGHCRLKAECNYYS